MFLLFFISELLPKILNSVGFSVRIKKIFFLLFRSINFPSFEYLIIVFSLRGLFSSRTFFESFGYSENYSINSNVSQIKIRSRPEMEKTTR